MGNHKKLQFIDLSCVIDSDGLNVTIIQNERSPILKEYQEKYKLGGIIVGGKTYAERCYDYDMERWLAVREIKDKKYEIDSFREPITTNYEGKVFRCILLSNGKVKVL